VLRSTAAKVIYGTWAHLAIEVMNGVAAVLEDPFDARTPRFGDVNEEDVAAILAKDGHGGSSILVGVTARTECSSRATRRRPGLLVPV
jgi:hypothetical protein